MIAPERDKLREAGLLLLAVAAIHNAIGLNAGYWMTRAAGVIGAKIAARLGKGDGRKTLISEADCRTIAIEVGMQNGAMGTALANKFISSTAALVPNIFGVWMDISGSILAKWWSNHPPEEERS
jgi:BASS family bile acid:Na+ symporter